MNHLLQDNLEVFITGTGTHVRCATCRHVLGEFGEDWRIGCAKMYFPPTKVGPLMQDLAGEYLIEQICCPSCGALYSTELVEKDMAEKK